MKTLWLSLIVTLLFGFGAAQSDAEGRYGGVLRIGYHNPLDNFDVMTTTAVRDELAQMMLEPLVTMDEGLQPVAHLAKSWEVSEDELVWTFTLREGVEFHDGSVLSSADAVASFDRFMRVGERRGQFSRVDSWEAIDDLNIRFHLSEPWGAFAETLAMPSGGFVIHPKHILDVVGDETIRDMEQLIGTGPYMMVERIPEERYRFVRYENYQSPPGEPSGLAGQRYAYLDEIIMIPIPDEAARTAALLAGEVDIATQLSSDDLLRLQADPNIEADVITPGRRVYLKMNPVKGPFSDPLLRRAVITALDLDTIMSVQGPEGTWRVNTAPRFQEGQWMWDEAPNRQAYVANLEEARRLVSESSYNGEPVRYIVTDSLPSMIRHAPIVLETLQAIGLNAQMVQTDWAGWLDHWLRFDDWEIKASTGGSVVAVSYLDAGSRDRGGTLWPDFPIDEWSELMTASQRELAEDARRAAVTGLNQLSIDYGAEVWIGETFPVIAARSHVRNLPTWHYASFYNIWLDQ